MQCPNCGGGLICPRCSSSTSEISRLNQLTQQLSDELQRIKAESRQRITRYRIFVSISIPISVAFYLTSNQALGKAIFDYVTQKPVIKSGQPNPSNSGSNSLDNEAKIQPHDSTTAKDFTIEEPIKGVNIKIDVACQNCTDQPPIIRVLDENGELPLPDGHSYSKGTVNYTGYVHFPKGHYRIVIDNPSDYLIEIRYQVEVR